MRSAASTFVFAMLVAGCGDNAGPDGVSLAVTTRPAGELAAGLEHELDVVVRVTDEDGPVAGAVATWASVTAGDSMVAETQTNADGYARGVWYVGPSAGQHTLTVAAAGTADITIATALMAFRPDELSVGHQFACGTRDGEIWCWGKHPDAVVPMRIAAGWTFTDVDVEVESACGLTIDGTAVCWDKTTMSGGTAPVEFLGGPVLTQMASLEGAVCGLTASGTPWCGGPEYPGGATVITGAPPLWKLAATAGPFDRLAACGLAQTDSTAWCWGSGAAGSMGDGTTEPSYAVARQVSGGVTYTDIAASSESMCAVQGDQQVACWGYGFALPGFGSDQPVPTVFSETAVTLSGGWLGYLATASTGPDFWGGYLGDTDADSTFAGLDGITTYELGDVPCVIQAGVGASCSIGLTDEIGFHGWQRLRPFMPVPDPDLVE